jgi:hypothetical protein
MLRAENRTETPLARNTTPRATGRAMWAPSTETLRPSSKRSSGITIRTTAAMHTPLIPADAGDCSWRIRCKVAGFDGAQRRLTW